MSFNPDKYQYPARRHRRSIRLKGYDYTSPGWYFITLVVHDRKRLLGKIIDREMILNAAGEIIEKYWLKIPELRSYIELDAFSIMPDHFHGIIIINEDPDKVRATESVAPTIIPKLSANSLGAILGQFKSATTKEIKKTGINNFSWQRNYWERIIRDENELNRIRKYIIENPLNWQKD